MEAKIVKISLQISPIRSIKNTAKMGLNFWFRQQYIECKRDDHNAQ